MSAFTATPATRTPARHSQLGFMEQIKRSLQNYGEKVVELKKVQDTTDYRLHLERSKANLNRIVKQDEDNDNTSEQRAKLEKAFDKKFSDFEKRIVKEHTAQLKQVLSDQRAVFANMLEQEHDIANELLQKTRHEYNEEIRKEQDRIDCWNNQSRALVEELVNDRSKIMSLIENLMSLIEQQEVQSKMNVEVPDQRKMKASIALDSDEEADEMEADEIGR